MVYFMNLIYSHQYHVTQVIRSIIEILIKCVSQRWWEILLARSNALAITLFGSLNVVNMLVGQGKTYGI